ncbi:unnamed protein product [Rotaria sp. Silwood1]|nr:unnamed protein product [Rotaria sp. Silwood1]
MLYPIIEAFGKLGLPGVRNDDFFDRLSRKYSVVIFGICFIIVTTTQFVSDPIHCFTQMVDSKYKIDYVNWVCWISSSYYLPFDKPLPNRNQSRPEKIPYYQWVPFILFGMMILFYIPGFIWRKINRNCGIDTKVITSIIADMDPLHSENRQDAMNMLVKQIDKALTYHRDYHHGFMFSTWKRFSCLSCCSLSQHSGNYLACGYILVKLLYIANAIGQLFLLNIFMGQKFYLYGFEVLQKWFHGQEIKALERFPRITMCRFILRTFGDNIQPYDVQCLLPINIYNEKIFLMIWFWLAFVSIMSIYSLIKWLHYFTFKSRKNFIHHFLKANQIDCYSENTTHLNTEILPTFVDRYCRQDGILLLRIVNANATKVLVGELVCALWNHWQKQRQIRIDSLPQHTNNHKGKLLEDHDNNQLGLIPLTIPISIINDDRYVTLPPQEIHKDTLVTGDYDITDRPGLPTHLEVKDTKGHILYNKEDAIKGKFAFTTEEFDIFDVCFETKLLHGQQQHHLSSQHTTKQVTIHLKHGVETKDYDALAKANKLKPLEIELNRLEDLSTSIVSDFAFMKEREEEMRNTNESTNTKVLYFSIFSMCCLMSLAIWQVLYLRRYFKAKKLID